MDSYKLLKSSDSDHHQQVQNCCSSSLCITEMQRACSKAQNCLFKIIRIISTVPPHNNNTSMKLNGCNGFDVDLNIEFNHVPPSEEEQSGSPVDGGQTIAAECGASGEKSVVQQLGVCETNKSEEKLKEEKGFMGLLIEAATLIFGDFKDENPKLECEAENKSCKSVSTRERFKMDEQPHHHHDHVNKQVKRRNDYCAEEVIEDKSSYPLVRSKRGRIQVLPNKYKDSILEPLTSSFSRIPSTIVPNRPRSK